MPPRGKQKGSRLIPTRKLKEYQGLILNAERIPENYEHYQEARFEADLRMILLNERRSSLSPERRSELTNSIQHRTQSLLQHPLTAEEVTNLITTYLKNVRALLWEDLAELMGYFTDELPSNFQTSQFSMTETFPEFREPDLIFKATDPDYNFGEVNFNALVYLVFDDEPNMERPHRDRRSSKRGVGISAYSQRILGVIEYVIRETHGVDLKTFQRYSMSKTKDMYTIIGMVISWEANAINKKDPFVTHPGTGVHTRVGFDLDSKWLARIRTVEFPF